MNKFDEKYNIRLAHIRDIDNIMNFIDTYWKKGHIIGTQRDIFEYEFVDGESVNFILAEDKTTGELHGLEGYIPSSKDKKELFIWGSIWKVRTDVAMPMLGVELVKRLPELTGARYKLSIGMNPKTAVPIMKFLMGQQVEKMHHYYCLAKKEKYEIAEVKHFEYSIGNSDQSVEVAKFENIQELLESFDLTHYKESVPYKDEWYINRRYFQHPVYLYEVYGLREPGRNVEALLVCRSQEHNTKKCLRIVDYIGDERVFGGLYRFFQEKLAEYEYIDFYFWGIDEEFVKKAGMIELTENDSNIIPNYFMPFEKKNIDIWVSLPTDGCRYFKADGDQDRPNGIDSCAAKL